MSYFFSILLSVVGHFTDEMQAGSFFKKYKEGFLAEKESNK